MFERAIEVRYAMFASEFAALLDEVVAFDESGEWRADGATSVSAWLAGRFGMARGTAREMVRVGRALRSLPAVQGAFSRGELSFDQLKPLTHFATPDEDETWAGRAGSLSPAQLWSECRRRQRIEREH